MELVAFVILAALALGLAPSWWSGTATRWSARWRWPSTWSPSPGFYLLLNAQFMALLQIIVYAGAIMVLILFVIMLLNLPDEAAPPRLGLHPGWSGLRRWPSAFAVDGSAGRSPAGRGRAASPQPSAGFGTVRALGTELFTTFFYPFEAISLLLVVAMIGAVLLAKRRL